jgi:hypothetical protein
MKKLTLLLLLLLVVAAGAQPARSTKPVVHQTPITLPPLIQGIGLWLGGRAR